MADSSVAWPMQELWNAIMGGEVGSRQGWSHIPLLSCLTERTVALMSLALRKWTLEERRAPDEGKADREFGGVCRRSKYIKRMMVGPDGVTAFHAGIEPCMETETVVILGRQFFAKKMR